MYEYDSFALIESLKHHSVSHLSISKYLTSDAHRCQIETFVLISEFSWLQRNFFSIKNFASLSFFYIIYQKFGIITIEELPQDSLNNNITGIFGRRFFSIGIF